MWIKIHLDKLKCACCCKIIPNGQITMLSKEIDGLQEAKINHLCMNCFNYTKRLCTLKKLY